MLTCKLHNYDMCSSFATSESFISEKPFEKYYSVYSAGRQQCCTALQVMFLLPMLNSHWPWSQPSFDNVTYVALDMEFNYCQR